jgi:ABC-type Fe3+ transport system substrate-binding protein
MLKLSERQRGKLLVIEGDMAGAVSRNGAAAKRGKFRREPVGHVAAPERTLYALERRGLVAKAPLPDSATALLWTLTPEGKESLDANREQ